ncbi:MAG: S-layer homology domain-containing protein [Candidatus Gracilibacteria bacterium]|nr:S-layer homology domain-containing protein [Candidatus Gracilibacteria bacterium]
MKKICSFLAVLLVILVPATSFAAAGFTNLADVSKSDLDYKAIEYLNKHDVIYGYYDGTFKPDNSVTRAELLKILLEADGVDTSSYQESNVFSDVPSSNSLAQYVNYAAKKGYVGGYPDGTFKPNNSVTRAEAAKILLNTFNLGKTNFADSFIEDYPLGGCHDHLFKSHDKRDTSDWCYKEFTDVPTYHDLAKYIYVLTRFNFLTVPGTEFGVGNKVTRREAARMIYRMICVRRVPNQIYNASVSTEPLNLGSDSQTSSASYPGRSLVAMSPRSWIITKPKKDNIVFTMTPKQDTSTQINIYWKQFETGETTLKDVAERLASGQIKEYELFDAPFEVPVVEFDNTILAMHPDSGYLEITMNKAISSSPYFSVFYRIVQYFVYDNLVDA